VCLAAQFMQLVFKTLLLFTEIIKSLSLEICRTFPFFCSYLLLGVKGDGTDSDQCVLEDCILFFFLTLCMVNVFQNPVATAFEIFWMIFEPILFGLAGSQIKFNELDRDTVGIGTACLITGIVVSV